MKWYIIFISSMMSITLLELCAGNSTIDLLAEEQRDGVLDQIQTHELALIELQEEKEHITGYPLRGSVLLDMQHETDTKIAAEQRILHDLKEQFAQYPEKAEAYKKPKTNQAQLKIIMKQLDRAEMVRKSYKENPAILATLSLADQQLIKGNVPLTADQAYQIMKLKYKKYAQGILPENLVRLYNKDLPGQTFDVTKVYKSEPRELESVYTPEHFKYILPGKSTTLTSKFPLHASRDLTLTGGPYIYVFGANILALQDYLSELGDAHLIALFALVKQAYHTLERNIRLLKDIDTLPTHKDKLKLLKLRARRTVHTMDILQEAANDMLDSIRLSPAQRDALITAWLEKNNKKKLTGQKLVTGALDFARAYNIPDFTRLEAGRKKQVAHQELEALQINMLILDRAVEPLRKTIATATKDKRDKAENDLGSIILALTRLHDAVKKLDAAYARITSLKHMREINPIDTHVRSMQRDTLARLIVSDAQQQQRINATMFIWQMLDFTRGLLSTYNKLVMQKLDQVQHESAKSEV